MDSWTLAGEKRQSRLLVGTGKYRTLEEAEKAIDASGAEIVTVALRRVDLSKKVNVMSAIDRSRYSLLPNTAGCYNIDDALRVAYMARELGVDELLKLEVIGDEKTLLPDNEATLEAAKKLVDDGFAVMAYCSDDLILCKKLESVGCAAVMPLAAPIGSGLGICNPYNIKTIAEELSVPVIVDAGIGTASDAALAMELGCSGVLLNSAIAGAKEPVQMATAMKLAVEAGRHAYLAGRIPKKRYATASSPLEGTI